MNKAIDVSDIKKLMSDRFDEIERENKWCRKESPPIDLAPKAKDSKANSQSGKPPAHAKTTPDFKNRRVEVGMMICGRCD